MPDHPVAKPLERKPGQFLIGEGLVDGLSGEIIVQHFGKQDERVHIARRLRRSALWSRRRRFLSGRRAAPVAGVPSRGGRSLQNLDRVSANPHLGRRDRAII
jgi:hypothetical protein